MDCNQCDASGEGNIITTEDAILFRAVVLFLNYVPENFDASKQTFVKALHSFPKWNFIVSF
jgi:hypothetical protein